MIRPREPVFRFLWPVDPTDALLEAAKADAPDVMKKVQTWLEHGFSGDNQKQIREALENTAHEMVAFTATRIQATVAIDADEMNVLHVTALRDLGWRWYESDWRARLSYRQLVQTRLWAKRLTSASARPYVANLCVVESLFTEAADVAIAKKYGPWLDSVVKELARLTSPLRPRTRILEVAAAAARHRLGDLLGGVADRPYNEVVWKRVS